MIRKCEKRAYSVSGAPVVTLGVVDVEFKINGASYTHSFIILRGLIHPLLIGLDFLTKYGANIQFDNTRSMTLRHPVLKSVLVDFLKPASRVKPPTYVSLLNDIKIPASSIYYAEAHITNVEYVGGIESVNPERIMGISAIQKTDSFFDPGFIMRDAVIDAKSATFTVELMNPSQFDLKVEAGTPLGAIFDEDCEIMNINDQEQNQWEEHHADNTEAFPSQTTADPSINVVRSMNATKSCPPLVTKTSTPLPTAPLPAVPPSTAPLPTAPFPATPLPTAPFPATPLPTAPFPAAPLLAAPHQTAPLPVPLQAPTHEAPPRPTAKEKNPRGLENRLQNLAEGNQLVSPTLLGTSVKMNPETSRDITNADNNTPAPPRAPLDLSTARLPTAPALNPTTIPPASHAATKASYPAGAHPANPLLPNTQAFEDPLKQQGWENPESRQSKSHFTPAFGDDDGRPRFAHRLRPGQEINAENKDFIFDLGKCDAIDSEQKQELENAINDFPKAFAKNKMDIGCTNLVFHHAKIDDPQPAYTSYYKVQDAEVRKEIEDQTQGLLAAGVIKESESPYCSPMLLVKKKFGGWRYCVDLRKINKMTTKSSFPLPKIEDSLRKLKNPKVFSSLDLLKAYYQIPVVEEHQKYYAYSDGRRHLQFARCPMGAKNSGSTLALLMELVLRGLPPESVLGYLDDILIATEDWESHIAILKRLFKALEHAGLKLCPGKCHFARTEVKTLGYSLSSIGIKADDFNLDKVKKWSDLKDKSEVRTFLGLTGYYRSLMKDYANIAAPLTDLLHDKSEWKWDSKEQEAFSTLKNLLVSEPIASFPDYEKPFILKTDASKVAMGAVLCQKKEGNKECMIACTSKKFNADELRWIPYDREYWAVVYAVRHFSHYLRFKPFQIVTDHKPLLAWRDITTQKDGFNKRTRWAMELSSYDFIMTYKEGRRHTDADALSRHPNPDEPDEEKEDEIISQVNAEFIAASYLSEVPLVEIHSDETAVKEMRGFQAKDENIHKAIGLLKSGTTDIQAWKTVINWYLQNRDNFVLSQDVLYHVKSVQSFDRPIARTVIPENKRAEMLFKAHGHLQSGHPSAQRALARLEKFAIWPGPY